MQLQPKGWGRNFLFLLCAGVLECWDARYNELPISGVADFSPWMWLASHLPNDGVTTPEDRQAALKLLNLLIANFEFDVLHALHQNVPRVELLKKVLSAAEMGLVEQSIGLCSRCVLVFQPPRANTDGGVATSPPRAANTALK